MVASLSETTIPRVVGNTEKIGGTLQDVDGNAIDVTGRTITFRMVSMADGSVKVNDQPATIETASSGEVSYTPQSSDVDTAGDFAIYFTDDLGRRWPYDPAKFVLRLAREYSRV